MQTIAFEVPHKLGKQEARRRIEHADGVNRAKLMGRWPKPAHLRWKGDRLCFEERCLCQKITGHIDVLDELVAVEADLHNYMSGGIDRLAAGLKKRVERYLS